MQPGEVEKNEQAWEERKKGLESKKKEKVKFVRKYFPTSCNLPSGTLKLIPTDVTSAGNRGVVKIETCMPAETFS